MFKDLRITNSQVSQFSSLRLAKLAASNQKYNVPVLLGANGKYLVASTFRIAGKLTSLGYEQV